MKHIGAVRPVDAGRGAARKKNDGEDEDKARHRRCLLGMRYANRF